MSTGKSSLLNHVVGIDVLPVGVTPVTAVPTRLESGESLAVVVSFAEMRPYAIAADQLWEYASEEGNPGNTKHVTSILVTVPSPPFGVGWRLSIRPASGRSRLPGPPRRPAYLPRLRPGDRAHRRRRCTGAGRPRPAPVPLRGGRAAMVLLSKADLLGPAGPRADGWIYPRNSRRARSRFARLPGERRGGGGIAPHPVVRVGPRTAHGPAPRTGRGVAPSQDCGRPRVSRGDLGNPPFPSAWRFARVRASMRQTFVASLTRPMGSSGRTRERFQDWATDREVLLDAILRKAARAVVLRRGQAPEAGDDPLAAAVRDGLGQQARAIHDLVARLREDLGAVLDGLHRSAPMPDADDASVQGMKFDGLPITDVEALRSGWERLCPWWIASFPGLRTPRSRVGSGDVSDERCAGVVECLQPSTPGVGADDDGWPGRTVRAASRSVP